MVLLGQKWFYSGKKGCILAKVVVFDQKMLNSGKLVVMEEKGLYSGKSGSYREQDVLFGQKKLYSDK